MSDHEQLYSATAEQSVIGGVMLDANAIDRVDTVESDFGSEAHRLIWRVISNLHERGDPLDPVTVSEALDALGHGETTGGLAYVGKLASETPSAANVTAYAGILREHAIRRSVIAECTRMIESARDRGQELSGVLDEAQRSILDLSMNGRPSRMAPASSYISEFLADTERRFEADGGMVGVPTGHTDVDKLIHGFEGGDLIVVAGRPSMGKTMLSAQWAENAAKGSGPVAFFSLEMSATQLIRRTAARIGRIPFDRLRSGQLDREDWPRLTQAVAQVKGLPLHIDDTGGISLQELCTRARRLHRQSPLSMVVVDYMQIVDPGSKEERHDIRIGRVATGLKNLAKELDCPVIAVAQLNRSVDSRSDKRPQMSDLREAGQLEQDADVIAFVYRDEVYNQESPYKGIAELIVRKQRNGPPGSVSLMFHGQYQSFEDIDPQALREAREAAKVGQPMRSGGFSAEVA